MGQVPERDLRRCDGADRAAGKDETAAKIDPDDPNLGVHPEEASCGPAQRLSLNPKGVEEVESTSQGARPFITTIIGARNPVWREGREATTPLPQPILRNFRNLNFGRYRLIGMT